jgi:hypothetical protein
MALAEVEEEVPALLAADPLAPLELAALLVAADEELLDELQPASTSAPAAARTAATAAMRPRRAGCLSTVTRLSFRLQIHDR